MNLHKYFKFIKFFIIFKQKLMVVGGGRILFLKKGEKMKKQSKS